MKNSKYEDNVWNVRDSVSSASDRLYCFSPYLLVINTFLKKKGSVLDLGCGTGKYAEYVASKGNSVIGLDVSRTAISNARQYRNEKTDLSFMVGNAEKLSFKNSSFDAVYSFDLLEHVNSPQKVLDEVERVLKPDGVFVLEFETSERTGHYAKLGNLNNKTISSWITGEEMLRLLAPRFKVVDYFYFGQLRRFSYAEALINPLNAIPGFSIAYRGLETLVSQAFKDARGVNMFVICLKQLREK